MKRTIHALALAVSVWTFMSDASGTDRFFADIVSESPSQRYKVTAKSPENSKKKGRQAFQAHFVYECRDTTTGKRLWTRKQAMGKPDPIEEGSPSRIFVSDIGWTVIETGWDELIAVDLAGKDRCHINFLRDAITGGEYKKYVRETTAGAMWTGCSLWYFLEAGDQHLFVIRPWVHSDVLRDSKDPRLGFLEDFPAFHPGWGDAGHERDDAGKVRYQPALLFRKFLALRRPVLDNAVALHLVPRLFRLYTALAADLRGPGPVERCDADFAIDQLEMLLTHTRSEGIDHLLSAFADSYVEQISLIGSGGLEG